MSYWRESKQGWVFQDRRYYIRRSSVATVAEAERWLAHLEEKNWATFPVLVELSERFSRHLGGRPVEIRNHHSLNSQYGFGYGNTLRSARSSAGSDRMTFETARADAIESGEFVMPADEAAPWLA